MVNLPRRDAAEHVIGQWRKVKTGYTVETNSSRIQAFAALPSWRALQWTRTLKGGAGIGS